MPCCFSFDDYDYQTGGITSTKTTTVEGSAQEAPAGQSASESNQPPSITLPSYKPISTDTAKSEQDQSDTIAPISKPQSLESSIKPGPDPIDHAQPQQPDPDEIAPVQPPRHLQMNVASALEDRRKLFERLRRPASVASPAELDGASVANSSGNANAASGANGTSPTTEMKAADDAAKTADGGVKTADAVNGELTGKPKAEQETPAEVEG